MTKLLIGGSPCTYWSIAQRNNRETRAEGLGWELFKNYLIAKEKFKPDFFLYENNISAARTIKEQIKQELNVWDGSLLTEDSGVRYIEINSALVSAQNRRRFYVHNCGEVQQPEDRGILLKDILETAICKPVNVAENAKSHTIKAQYYKNGIANFITNNGFDATAVAEPVNLCGQCNKKISSYEVKDGQITINNKKYPIKLEDGFYIIRKLTVKECARLQTMPDDYCRVVSNSQAYKGLGNGWTAEVIIHILWNALKNISKDEEIVVLSMYDGIGTGRYVLDKMGFTNVKYFAYEIDKYAKQIAMSNYPDIIQMGDAFQLRENDWRLPILYDGNK